MNAKTFVRAALCDLDFSLFFSYYSANILSLLVWLFFLGIFASFRRVLLRVLVR